MNFTNESILITGGTGSFGKAFLNELLSSRKFNGVIRVYSRDEYKPFEAVKTNILGTENVIDCSINNKVKKAVLISSDKAVNPVNLYGATKLVAEKLFVQGNSYVG